MKTAFSALLVLLTLCQCRPTPILSTTDLANRSLDYLLTSYRSDYTRYDTTRSFSNDSSSVVMDITPEYAEYPYDDSVQLATRWQFSVTPEAILPLSGNRYLVKYYQTDTEGNHYPEGRYLLLSQQNENVVIEKQLAYSEDDLDLTIKRASGEQFIAQTLNFSDSDPHCCPSQRDYFAVTIQGDSLIKTKRVTASDTL